MKLRRLLCRLGLCLRDAERCCPLCNTYKESWYGHQ